MKEHLPISKNYTYRAMLASINSFENYEKSHGRRLCTEGIFPFVVHISALVVSMIDLRKIRYTYRYFHIMIRIGILRYFSIKPGCKNCNVVRMTDGLWLNHGVLSIYQIVDQQFRNFLLPPLRILLLVCYMYWRHDKSLQIRILISLLTAVC